MFKKVGKWDEMRFKYVLILVKYIKGIYLKLLLVI